MRRFLIPIFASFIFACSGGHHDATPVPPPPPPVATPIAKGVYTAKIHTTPSAAILGATAPIGDIIQTMVVDQAGDSLLELPGWNMVSAVMTALPNGTIQLGSGSAFLTADGTLSPLALTNGTFVGNEITGTVNGGITFDVTLTAVQNTPIDLSTKLGTWLSTASNTGQVLRLTIPAPAVPATPYLVSIVAYANNADAVSKTNALATYDGTMLWTDFDPNHQLNLFQIGFGQIGAGGGAVSGLAYFDANGNMVVLTCRNSDNGQPWNKQLSAIFVKE